MNEKEKDFKEILKTKDRNWLEDHIYDLKFCRECENCLSFHKASKNCSYNGIDFNPSMIDYSGCGNWSKK